jgi:F-type H+-transporting ATPase subunit b
MLPQFDLTFFPSQIFWLFVCFGLFFAFIQFYFFPKMMHILEQRENKIKKESKLHEYNLEEIQKLHNSHNAMILEAKREASEKIKSASLKTKQFVEQRQAEIDKTLNEKFEVAKKELIAEMQNFEANINDEILNSAKQIIEKLEEKPVTLEDLKKFNANDLKKFNANS